LIDMHLQSIVVALLVIGCSVYVGWTLMFAVARCAFVGALANLTARWSLSAGVTNRLNAAANRTVGGCGGCDSCGPSPATPNAKQLPADTKPLVFHRKTPR